ncbi:LANO_0H13190g1_1 [Lachancea nothofagi CBS 11611]|uniref:M-phase inducer phosphatase n=1 Tax=Lachancea nothofagi CBS 11611 TaxID=1266666 RepID=A0A1G4KMA7_9SACH|nr:LANO_0H13190g1_1 [Lachancea nothofagi CBS 11611]
MSDPKSLTSKAKRSGLANTFQEGGSFLKNINLLKGISRKHSKNTRPASLTISSESECKPLTPPCSATTGQSSSNSDFGTQLVHISSTESSLSCDEDGGDGDCISPVVRQSSLHLTQSPFETKFHSEERKPRMRTPQRCLSRTNSASRSVATLKKNEPLVARSKALRNQPNGVKKETVSVQASRGKLRRIHSMFASEKEVSQGYDVAEASHMIECKTTDDNIESATFKSTLEKSGVSYYFDNSTDDNLPRISVETLVEIMDGRFRKYYQDVYIVDCRFEYEYQGGHIGQAVNINTQNSLESKFIHERHLICQSKLPPLMVFHCEFSSYRGPIMASHLRNCDRMLNYDNYPKLHYPDILIVEGGYKSFFDKYSDRCFPPRYIGMNSQEHIDLCETKMEKFRKDSKRITTRGNSFQTFSKSSTNIRPDLVPARANSSSRSQTFFPDYKEKPDLSYSSHFTTNSSLSFKYEAPPKLSFSNYGTGGESGSPSSVSSSNASSGLLLLDELRDDTGSTDLDNVSFEEDGEETQLRRGSNDSALAFKSTKRSLFGSILKEDGNRNTQKFLHYPKS